MREVCCSVVKFLLPLFPGASRIHPISSDPLCASCQAIQSPTPTNKGQKPLSAHQDPSHTTTPVARDPSLQMDPSPTPTMAPQGPIPISIVAPSMHTLQDHNPTGCIPTPPKGPSLDLAPTQSLQGISLMARIQVRQGVVRSPQLAKESGRLHILLNFPPPTVLKACCVGGVNRWSERTFWFKSLRKPH